MKLLGYSQTSTKCKNCGRYRVEEWADENGKAKLICEKCNWDQDEDEYFYWDDEDMMYWMDECEGIGDEL